MALVRMNLYDTRKTLVGKSTFERGKIIKRRIKEDANGTQYVRSGDFSNQPNAYVELGSFVLAFCTDFEIRETTC